MDDIEYFYARQAIGRIVAHLWRCVMGLVASYKIENAGKVENYLHNLFADKERHSEWFSLSKKDLSLIDSTLKRMGGIREPN